MNNFTGSKYELTRDLSLAEINKMIRADIKAAVKSGDLPAAKYAVTKSGNAIRVAISSLPFAVLNPAAFYLCGEWPTIRGIARERWTAEAIATREVVQEIVNAYNYDRSESMTDYFDTRFYLTVDLDDSAEYAELAAALRTERDFVAQLSRISAGMALEIVGGEVRFDCCAAYPVAAALAALRGAPTGGGTEAAWLALCALEAAA
jgi:hypothetical protein